MSEEAVVPPAHGLFGSEIKVIALGLESFAENIRSCGAQAVQVRWKPPAGGDGQMIAALDRISLHARVDVEAANREALSRIQKGKPTLVDVGIAARSSPA